MNEAYLKGKKARQSNSYKNPYAPGTHEHKEFLRGYYADMACWIKSIKKESYQ